MSKTHPIQTSFAAGELSHDLWGRIDTDIYKAGVFRSMNMIPDPRGPIERRAGSEHKNEVSTSNVGCVLKTFFYNREHTYVLAVSPGHTHVILPNGDMVKTVPNLYTLEDLTELQAEMHPSGLRIYFTHKLHHPTQLVYTVSTRSFVYEDVPFAHMPSDWGVNNYPRTVAIHQGRSWWAGTVEQPTGIWSSKSGDYDNLSPGGADDDGVTMQVPRHGTIMWMAASRELLVGTELDEFALLPLTASDFVLKTDNIKIVRQLSNGTSHIKPEMMHTSLMFVNANRNKLRSMWYSWTEDGWQSTDLTFNSNHILESHVLDSTVMYEPNLRMVLILENGNMAICSYYQDGEKDPVLGWGLHNTDGMFLSATRLQLNTGDELWVAVKRTLPTGDRIYVEKIALSGDKKFYLDSHKVTKFSTPTKVVTGLLHLEGKEVHPVVNEGAIHRPLTVSGGEITLDNEVDSVVVGLLSECYLETLPLITLAQGESTAGHMKRWVTAKIRLWDSAKPHINGILPPDRFPSTLMNTTEPNRTQLLDVTNLGRSVDASLYIDMRIPRALKVINITGELGANAL